MVLGLSASVVQSARITDMQVDLNDQGVAQMGQFKYSAAHKTFSRVVKLNSTWMDAKINLAIATLNRQEEDDENEAFTLLQEVLDVEPENARALYISGIISFHLGNMDTALDYFEKTAALDPQDAYANYFVGQTYLQLQKHKEAQERFLKAIELDPYLVSSYWAGALASRRLQATELADKLTEDYQRLQANPVARTASISYLQMGPKADAQSVRTKVVETALRPEATLFSVDSQLLSFNKDVNTFAVVAETSGSSSHGLFIAYNDSVSWYGLSLQRGRTNLIDSEPLADVVSLLVGDIDNDAGADLVTCGGPGVNVLHLDREEGKFTKNALLTWTKPCFAAVLIDIDHDGDLDVVASSEEGVFQLTNLRDDEKGFKELLIRKVSENVRVSSILASDLDSDRDVDLVFLAENGPTTAIRNDRTWNYEQFPGFSDQFESPLKMARNRGLGLKWISRRSWFEQPAGVSYSLIRR